MSPFSESSEESLPKIVSEFKTTPFLFIGSGITRRYCNLPNWDQLLNHFSNILNPQNEFAYSSYKYKAHNDYTILGSIIGEEFDIQWFKNQSIFDFSTESKHFIKQGVSPFKCAVSEYIRNITNSNSAYVEEENLFKEVLNNNISGVITTNYDTYLENLVPDFKTYISQKDLLFSSLHELGEIYKIHGSITNPNTIVINHEDYKKFNDHSKYLASKLLTIFVEYPIIFMGYSLSDPNIKQIITDITTCLDEKSLDKLSNRFIMVTRAKDDDPDITIKVNQYEVNNTHIPMLNIQLKNYTHLYKALKTIRPSVPIKLLRLYRESFYKHTLTTTKVKNILVNIDDEHVKPEDLVFTLSKPGTRSLLGLTGISTKDWYLNILYDTLDFSADDLLTYAYPQLYKANNKLPAYKILAQAEGRYPKIESDIHINDINDLLNTTLIKIKARREYSSESIQSLTNTLSREKAIVEIQYLPKETIDIDELYNFLNDTFEEIPNIFTESTLSTAFKRLIRIYDWLKYNES